MQPHILINYENQPQLFINYQNQLLTYRIIWHISPPYVARARQMPSLRRGLIAKGFTMVDGLCAIQILQRPSQRGGLYARGAYSEGGAYMPDYTVFVIA